uniref:Uncharacterized protein n=1 Tax=Anguilla anguilla TaxID=7936 RepID=A0A0E9WJ72_ANGAN
MNPITPKTSREHRSTKVNSVQVHFVFNNILALFSSRQPKSSHVNY